MAEPALKFDNVSFSFGKGRAVEEVSLEVGAGEVVALVGPEGAGKSTLVRLALGLLRPSEGDVGLFGFDPVSEGVAALRRVGAVLCPPSFHEGWTGRRNLRYAADLRGFRDEERVNWAISRLGLGSRVDQRVERLSASFRQRLALARSLVGGPSLLVLDEPTRALGTEAARRFRGLVKMLARDAGVATLVATSSLDEAVECAERPPAGGRIAVVEAGRIIHEGPASQVLAARGGAVLTIVEHAERAAEDLVRVRGVPAELTSPETIRLGARADASEVASWLVSRGYSLTELSRRFMTLDELLVHLAREPLPPAAASAPRPEEVADVLELLDDGDTDLSAFLDKRGGKQEGNEAPAERSERASSSGGTDQPA